MECPIGWGSFLLKLVFSFVSIEALSISLLHLNRTVNIAEEQLLLVFLVDSRNDRNAFKFNFLSTYFVDWNFTSSIKMIIAMVTHDVWIWCLSFGIQKLWSINFIFSVSEIYIWSKNKKCHSNSLYFLPWNSYQRFFYSNSQFDPVNPVIRLLLRLDRQNSTWNNEFHENFWGWKNGDKTENMKTMTWQYVIKSVSIETNRI